MTTSGADVKLVPTMLLAAEVVYTGAIDLNDLFLARQHRLRSTMAARGIPALLTADPINISYACGARNMTLFSFMGPSRLLLMFTDGPTVMFEFAGCEHLLDSIATIDEIRDAASATPTEIGRMCARLGVSELAVERFDVSYTDGLRSSGLTLRDATPVLMEARRIKQPSELAAIRAAVERVDTATAQLEAAIEPGASEVEVWSQFHQRLMATDGEYVSTRLFQAGPNTFPYFQEAGPRPMQRGELVCLDTDAIGYRGYAVDYSRTFVCDAEPTARQRELYQRAYDQLHHNAALLAPGRSYESVARSAWSIPVEHRPYGYYCVGHGLGLCGEPPTIPLARDGEPYTLAGEFEPNMVVCIESYIGDASTGQGVKLEDQFLITETGAERMTTYPFNADLLGI
jgi:Xaa-Pro dipeptidase